MRRKHSKGKREKESATTVKQKDIGQLIASRKRTLKLQPQEEDNNRHLDRRITASIKKKKWNNNDKGKGKGKANFGRKKWIREADLEEEEDDDEKDINFIDNMRETLGQMDEDMRKEFFMALQKDFH